MNDIPIHRIELQDFDGAKLTLESAGFAGCGIKLSIGRHATITLPADLLAKACIALTGTAPIAVLGASIPVDSKIVTGVSSLK